MALPEEFLMEVRARSDIESIVGGYVNLRRTGRNLKGLCPFHAEKTPSFTVYPENGSFYCFGCGVGGDVITFVRKVENLDYLEAVKMLAEKAGMHMPEDHYDDGVVRAKRRIREINREAGRFFYKTLVSAQDKKGLSYIIGRGITEEGIRHFGLGYAPDYWDSLSRQLLSLGFTNEEIALADLGFKNKLGGVNDRFRDRLMFPIIDLQGNIIAFGGRDLSGQSKAKYVNTGDTLIYKKTNNLFALNFAKNMPGDTLILGEGYMDVISMHLAGFKNAVASCGTALTAEQAQLISRYAKTVIIAYDADEAGQKAVRRAIPILRRAGLLIKVLVVKGGKDPDEYIRANGAAGFKILVERAVSDVDYLLDEAKKRYNTDSAEGKVAYLNDAAGILSELDVALERDAYAGRLSQELSIDKGAILQQVGRYRKKDARERKQKESALMVKEASGRNDKVNTQRASHPAAADAEDKLLAYLFNNQQEFEYIIDVLKPEDMATEFNRRVYKRYIELFQTLGRVELSGFSSDFSEMEFGAIHRSVMENSGLRYDKKDAERWMKVILDEKKRLTDKEIAESSPDELIKLMEEMKKKKL